MFIMVMCSMHGACKRGLENRGGGNGIRKGNLHNSNNNRNEDKEITQKVILLLFVYRLGSVRGMKRIFLGF